MVKMDQRFLKPEKGTEQKAKIKPLPIQPKVFRVTESNIASTQYLVGIYLMFKKIKMIGIPVTETQQD